MGRDTSSISEPDPATKSPSHLTSPTLVVSGADETDSENERDENLEEQEEEDEEEGDEMAKEEEEEKEEENSASKTK